jgi:hypothetical protein
MLVWLGKRAMEEIDLLREFADGGVLWDTAQDGTNLAKVLQSQLEEWVIS